MKRLHRLGRSFLFAGEGVVWAWRHQPNLRIELIVGALALAMAFALGADPVPIVLISILVIALELLNSAIEAVVDLASPDIHPLAKRAKDVAAGAVLLASLAAVLVGLLVLGPPLVATLGGNP
jgi:diacylglycerol kinase (ATP)